jgi:hypothetical protein
MSRSLALNAGYAVEPEKVREEVGIPHCGELSLQNSLTADWHARRRIFLFPSPYCV